MGFPPTDLAIGHTRWATNGGVTEANAHPHLNEDGKLAVVHNGIIENYQPLKERLLQCGHTFRSETDTEILVHLYEEARKKMADPQLAFRLVWEQLSGLNAVVLLDLSARRLFFGRSGSPLAIGRLKDGYVMASDGAALAGVADEAVYLEDGWFGFLGASEAEFFRADGERFLPDWRPITVLENSADDARFPHRTLQEIHDQPAVLERLAQSVKPQFFQAAALIRSARKVFVLGCGTAYYAGQIGSSLLAETGVFSSVILANESDKFDRFVDQTAVIIAVSQSGETIDLLEPLARWKKRGAKIIAVVNSPFSSLDRMADLTLHLKAGREKAVASTKAFTAQIGVLSLIAAELGDHFSEGKRELEMAGKSAKNRLTDQNWLAEVERLAVRLADKPNLFILGRGSQKIISLEAALKIKELSYLHAEGMAAGELKHGTLALIEPGVPSLLFFESGQEIETETTARELKARGGFTIGVGPAPSEVFDHYLPVKGVGLAGLVEAALVAQLLSYYLAVLRGNNPDRPRNLAKSVTVK